MKLQITTNSSSIVRATATVYFTKNQNARYLQLLHNGQIIAMTATSDDALMLRASAVVRHNPDKDWFEIRAYSNSNSNYNFF